MAGTLFPQLPPGWHDRLVALTANNCWVWLGEFTHFRWEIARSLIAQECNAEPTECRITPSCVNPTHGPNTRPSAGAGS